MIKNQQFRFTMLFRFHISNINFIILLLSLFIFAILWILNRKEKVSKKRTQLASMRKKRKWRQLDKRKQYTPLGSSSMKPSRSLIRHLNASRTNTQPKNNSQSLTSVLMLEDLMKIKFTLSSHFIEIISEEETLSC